MGKIIPVILCGGAGSRLAPVSTPEYPKQFLKLTDNNKTLLQKTAERARLLSSEPVLIVTGQSHIATVENQLSEFDHHILAEPVQRNTAAAIALAARYVSKTYSSDDIMLVMPCDGYIENEDALQEALKIAVAEAAQDRMAIFGIKPDRPETGYGYIRIGPARGEGAHIVERFIEKPDAKTALAYLNSGVYLWNSGMFVFRAATVIKEFSLHAPDIISHLDNYDRLPSLSFDIAVLEKTANLSVIPCDLKWADIGSWRGLWEVLQKNNSANNEFYEMAKSQQQ